MFRRYFERKLKLENLPTTAVDISVKFLFFTLLTTMLTTITSTFIILHVIDLVGIRGLGIILSISFLVTALTDYPTGALSDWIGHRNVLTIAYIFFGIGSVLIAVAHSFSHLTIAFTFVALGTGQSSGALQSWFDNKYKIYGELSDPNKEHYREFLGLVKKYTMAFGSILFLVGGYIAYILPEGRRIVFLIQALGMFFAAFLFFLFLERRNTHQIVVDDENNPKLQRQSFKDLMVQGIKFTFSTRPIFFYLVSAVLFIATTTVWYNLILFPLYYGYTGSDAGAGTYRWVLWLTGSLISVKSGSLAKKLTEKTWLPRLKFLASFFYMGLTGLIIAFVPIHPAKFNLLGIILIYVNFVLGYYFFETHNYLSQKLYMDVIPDETRNSVYSLLPTLGLLISTPLIIVISLVIDGFGVPVALGILLALSTLSAIFQYLSLRHYKPKPIVEMIYDVYSFGCCEKMEVQIPQQWYLSKKIKSMHTILSSVNNKLSTNQGLMNRLEENLEEIIYQLMVDLKNYAENFERANLDGRITEDEKIELLLRRNEILVTTNALLSKNQLNEVQLMRLLEVINYAIMELQEEEQIIMHQPLTS